VTSQALFVTRGFDGRPEVNGVVGGAQDILVRVGCRRGLTFGACGRLGGLVPDLPANIAADQDNNGNQGKNDDTDFRILHDQSLRTASA
jgi:hypothetical protein